jgi:protein-S-isoprenylcysteine O-methyltransferase Ste14
MPNLHAISRRVPAGTRATLTSALIAAVAGALIALRAKSFVEHESADTWRILPGVVIYAGFGVYWEIAARRASGLAQSESRASSLFHQILIGLSLVLIVLPVPGLLGRFLPDSYLFLGLGLAVELVGVGIAIWARRVLGSRWSREVAITEEHQLVRDGPYARVRHPIYAGALLIYVGLALAVGRVHALAGLALVCIAYWRKISMEERILENAYGAGFRAYRLQSRLLIPFVL